MAERPLFLGAAAGWREPAPPGTYALIAAALAEDVGSGDLSVRGVTGTADYYIEAQAEGTVCGLGIAANLLPGCLVLVRDGDAVKPGDLLLRGRGEAATVLTHERTALNFLMHLSGIATHTAKFVREIEGTGARVVDTRKTVPGLRHLAKYAVRCGGGSNHRIGLFDGAMVKDNHIVAAGGIAPAVAALRAQIPHTVRIEVECDRAEQVAEAIAAGADIVLLDNMSPEEMRAIVAEHKGRALFEASGGITLATVRGAAESGVDLVSVGAITHSSSALSLHLEFKLADA